MSSLLIESAYIKRDSGYKDEMQVRVAIVWIKVCDVPLIAYSKAILIGDIKVSACAQIYIITFGGRGKGDSHAIKLDNNCVKIRVSFMFTNVRAYKKWEWN